MVAKNFPKPAEPHPFLTTRKQIVIYLEAKEYNRVREVAMTKDWSLSNCAMNLIKVGLRYQNKELQE